MVDKVKLRIDPNVATGEVVDVKDLGAQMRRAGWSDDPGTGRAFHLDDGREVLNPVPMAPPIGYIQEPTMMDMIDAQIRRRLALLQEDDEIDTVEEFDDFDVAEDVDPLTLYEVIDMREDSPPNAPPVVDPAPKAPEVLPSVEDIPKDGGNS